MDAKSLRFAADCWETKGNRLYDEGKEVAANQCWDMMIKLREEANQLTEKKYLPQLSEEKTNGRDNH